MFLSLLVFPTKRDIVVGKFKSYGILPEALCDVASDFLFQKASRLVQSIFRDVLNIPWLHITSFLGGAWLIFRTSPMFFSRNRRKTYTKPFTSLNFNDIQVYMAAFQYTLKEFNSMKHREIEM